MSAGPGNKANHNRSHLGNTCAHPVSYFCGTAQVIVQVAPPSQTRGSRGEALVSLVNCQVCMLRILLYLSGDE